MHWVNYWVRQCAGWYINTELLEAQMDNFEENNRALIVMIREQWPSYKLCAILRQLLEERVSIRNLTEVLDVLLRIDGPLAVDNTQVMPYFPPVSRVVVVPPSATSTELSTAQLAGQVRINLKYPIVYPHMKSGVLPCYTFDPVLLRDFRDGFFSQGLPQPGNTFQRLLALLYNQTKADFPSPDFLVPSGIRNAVVESLRPYFPLVAVLGHEEIPAFFIPSVKATINLS
jgi:flagellar biosynthesis component FlhA